MSRQLVVLGMHRSYTSLLSSWLHVNGLPMFDSGSAMPPHAEDQDILRLHNDLLSHHGMNAINARGPFEDPDGHFHARAAQITEDRNRRHGLWGWKEPRTSILYSFLWKSLLPDARIVILYRDPEAVVESLLMRKIYHRIHHRYIPDSIYAWYAIRNRLQYDEPHLISWNYYNRCLIQLAGSLDERQRVVVYGNTLPANEMALRDFLKSEWDITLGQYSIKELVKRGTVRKHMMNTSIDQDIRNESAEILKTLHSLRSV